MKILVIGGSGFVGSHVADYLMYKGYKVTIFDKNKSKWLKKNHSFIKGDIFDKSLEIAVKQSNIIYNFAAISDIDISSKFPEETALINIVGTIKILKLAKKYKVLRFIQASSIYVNSEDGSFYRCSKKAAEEFIEEFAKLNSLKFTIIRFGSIFGERSDLNNGVYKLIYSGIRNKKISYYGFPQTVRRYINIKDVCKGCLEVLKKRYENLHILLTGNQEIRVKDLIKIISKRLKINNIEFRKEITSGHYIKSPFTFKPRKGKYLKLKNTVNFKKSINELITSILKNESLQKIK